MKLTYLTYCPRSGSTKLASILAETCLVIPEFRTPIRLAEIGAPRKGNQLRAVLNADTQLGENLRLGPDEIDAVVDRVQTGTMHEVCEAIVEQWCVRRDVPVPDSAVLKLGRLIEYAPGVLDSDGSAQFIFVIRDPRAVVRSMHTSRTPRTGGSPTFSRGNPYYAIRMWRSRLDAYDAAEARAGGRVRIVRFEDLGDDVMIKELTDFIGFTPNPVPFAVSRVEESLHTNVGRDFDVARNRSWMDELSPRLVRHLEAQCRDGMNRFGYDATTPAQTRNQIAASVAETLSRPVDLLGRARARWGHPQIEDEDDGFAD